MALKEAKTEKNGETTTVNCSVRQENGAILVCVVYHTCHTQVAMDTQAEEAWLDSRGHMCVRHRACSMHTVWTTD